MQESFILKAKENLQAAELLYYNNLFNASASRAYYAAFHAAISALYSIGIEPKVDHKSVQVMFADNFFNRRKIITSKYKRYLVDLQDIRNNADYRINVSKKISKQQLNQAKELIEIIFEVIK